jgi:hypothetical protein
LRYQATFLESSIFNLDELAYPISRSSRKPVEQAALTLNQVKRDDLERCTVIVGFGLARDAENGSTLC